MNKKEIIELAKSILQGKPTDKCPLPFSYVKASYDFAKYILDSEIETLPELPPDDTIVVDVP